MTSISTTYPIPARTEQIIEKYKLGTGLVGIPGGLLGPGADLAIVIPSWINMTVELAENAGCTFEKQAIKKIVTAVVCGIGALGVGTKAASSGIAWLTAPLSGGLSLLVSAFANAGLNFAFTHAYGRACARVFERVEEIDDLEMIVSLIVFYFGVEAGLEVAEETIREAVDALNA